MRQRVWLGQQVLEEEVPRAEVLKGVDQREEDLGADPVV